MSIRRKQIRETVERLLDEHGVKQGAVPVEKIVRSMGIEVKLDNVDDDLSGFLFREDGRAVIGANKSHHPNRRRFTIAHELGHFLLHEGEVVHLDEVPASFTVDFRDNLSSRGEDDNEKEANLFAAELLMREAVTNAVVHGCGGDRSRHVFCRVRLKGRKLTIVVADNGGGFDWRAAWSRSAGLSDPSGRGIEILRRYSTRVRFNRSGNTVVIFKIVLVRE